MTLLVVKEVPKESQVPSVAWSCHVRQGLLYTY